MALTGLVLVVGIILAARDGKEFVLTADRQGQLMMDEGNFADAAETFSDPMRQASAHYRAGNFQAAASIYSGLPGEVAAFNQGNALVMLGKYEHAIGRYDRALELRPDWQAAKTNRQIARGRAERMKFEGGDMTGGEMGADEIVFDLKKSVPEAGEEVVSGGKELSDEELRGMWLRQVQTTPGDFLKAKFAYQQAMRQQPAEGQDE